ncbi:hypothetical protein HHI36_005300 [Cryptolaemus montrouzieri]|uniref:Carbohydrate kinase PfkB domain-containing protein n=1 Tax=Cryptolaemus montrouzieri TaxID=559131 RepID=A0ABD2NUL1_9CUCU
MHPSKFSYVAGGVARNISEALSKMGSSPTFITAIGDDETGRLLSSMMTEDLMKRAKIIKGKNTAQCIIVLDPQGDCSCLFADFEIHKQITPEMIIKNEEKISTAKLIVLDGNLTIKSIQQVLELATNYNIAVFFEPTDVIVSAKPFETNYWKAVKFITPNVQELLYIATKLNIVSPSIKNKFEGIEEISEVAKSLANYIDNVIVTLGSNGILIARRADASQPFLLASNEKDVRIRHYPAEIIENIVNVSGAGDCFASGLIMSMLEGKPEDICISVGLSAARQSLQSSFTVAKNMFDQNHSCWKSHARYIEI